MKHSSRGNIPRFAVPFIVSTISLLLVCFAFFSHSATAAIPSTMNFQGRLTDSTGTIMPDGLYNMQFRIYTVPTGGSATWSETREVSGTDYRVQVTNGLFSTQLGQRTALPASLFANTDLYFEITMANPATATCNTTSCQTWESPMTSRQKLATSAYAFNSDTLDGLDSTAFAAATGSTNYIQNTTTLQTADFTISGTGRVDTVLQAPSIQRTTNGTLLVGTTATTTGMTLGSTSLTGTLALDSGAASTITIGSSASTRTINIGNVAAIQTVTLGSTNTTSATTIQGGATGSITLATGGTINLNAGTVATNAATANFLNTTATTVNAFGAGTAITIGANSGTTTIRNSNVVVGNTTTRGTFTNNGATVSATLALGDLAAGAIGTAAATVDIYTGVTISPTAAGCTYTIPNPTSTTAGRQFYISNINATNSFTVLGQTIAPTTVVTLVWGGAAWSISSTGSAAGANTSLSNLSGVNLGTTALNSTSNNLNLTTTTSGNIILNSAGTIELQDAVNITGNLGVTGTITGTSTVQGTRLISTVATGTAPLTIASTTKVTNLNVDSLDGLDSTAFGQLSANNTWTGTNTYNVTNASALKVQNAGGTALLTADTSSGAVIFGQSSSLSGKLTLANSSNANTVSIVSGTTSTSYT